MQANYQLATISPHQDKYRWERLAALVFGILLSGGMLILPRVPMLILLIIFSLAATGWRGVAFSYTNKIWLLFIVILMAAIIRPGPFDVGSLIVRYANFIGGLLLLGTYLRSGYSLLAKDLFLIMPWMAAQAIITFFLANGLPSIFSVIALPDEGSMNTLLLIFNYHILIEDFSGWHRPDGFFWEPGVFQLYLNIYLYLALFIFKNKNHIIIAIAALICVFSTTGILITSLLLVTYLFKNLSKGKMQHRMLVFLVAILITPPFAYLAVQNIQDKFTGELQGSAMIRQYDLLVGLNVISKYPILGIGFDHNRYQEITPDLSFAQEQLGLIEAPERSNSNGIVYLGYTLGIPLGLLFIWGILKQKILPHPWLISVILMLSMVGEALIFTPFILMIIFSAFVKSRVKKHTPFIKTAKVSAP